MQCSAECGWGNQTRRVFCGASDDDGVITKVGDEECSAEERFSNSTGCFVPDEECKASWFTGPWSPVNDIFISFIRFT